MFDLGIEEAAAWNRESVSEWSTGRSRDKMPLVWVLTSLFSSFIQGVPHWRNSHLTKGESFLFWSHPFLHLTPLKIECSLWRLEVMWNFASTAQGTIETGTDRMKPITSQTDPAKIGIGSTVPDATLSSISVAAENDIHFTHQITTSTMTTATTRGGRNSRANGDVTGETCQSNMIGCCWTPILGLHKTLPQDVV